MAAVAHAHAHHAHASPAQIITSPEDRRRLWAALVLLLCVMGLELAAGAVGHSLALLSDAAHMLADAGALAVTLAAIRLAARPARGAMTFGFSRVEILSAQANGITLLVLAGFIVYEGVRRLVHPPHVHAWLMLAVALAGAAANVIVAWLIAGAERRSMNVEGSLQHVLTDLYAFAGTAVAAVVILASGFDRADAIASLLIAALMIRAGVSLVRASGRVFLEASPPGLDPAEIGRALVGEPAVVEVHDLHVWEISSGFPALSAHVLVGAESDCHAARRGLEAMLHERFGLDHTTLQVDHEHEATLLEIEPRSP